MRKFNSGAIRDGDDTKLDFEGCLSPLVLQEFAKYMKKHEQTAGGKRGSDNWQGHFGEKHQEICIKSFLRHAWDLWLEHRNLPSRDGFEDALNGCLFNLMAIADKYYKDKLSKNSLILNKKVGKKNNKIK